MSESPVNRVEVKYPPNFLDKKPKPKEIAKKKVSDEAMAMSNRMRIITGGRSCAGRKSASCAPSYGCVWTGEKCTLSKNLQSLSLYWRLRALYSAYWYPKSQAGVSNVKRKKKKKSKKSRKTSRRKKSSTKKKKRKTSRKKKTSRKRKKKSSRKKKRSRR